MRRMILSLMLLCGVCCVAAQSSRKLRLMSWNVENLFDTIHDEGFRDEEFLPQGERRWNSYRYWRKLDDISRVIAAVADDGVVPDLIGLCEVENDSVLATLTRRSLLRHLRYRYVVTHSEDERGIDVALLYQPFRFRLLDARSVRVPSRQFGLRPTRDFLYVRGLVPMGANIDTLHVVVVHLPSRAGGHVNDRNRRLAAERLWQLVDSIRFAAPEQQSHIVVMGDFNADSEDRVFRHAPLRITDAPEALGTYCYQGIWQWIDHILVSPSLGTSCLAQPLQLPWLLEPNKTYGVPMPRRTYRGPTYHGGISDHLPLVLDLQTE